MNEEDIKIVEGYIKDTPILPYECLMNLERNAIEHLLQAYKKQEKVIDEIIDFIYQDFDWQQSLCKEIGIANCIADEEYTNCDKCIKQYFTNKLKDIGGINNE